MTQKLTDLKVLRISSAEAEEWVTKKHYIKRKPSISFCFGLYQKSLLEGILTVGKPASHSLCEGICGKQYATNVYELNRLCVNDGLPRNTLSFFVGKCLKMLRKINTEGLILVSYADTRMGHHGYIYQATNWLYTGATKERTDIGFEDGKHSRHYNKDIDYSNRKFRSSKHRYVIFLGMKSKEFRKALQYNIMPYPKGENKRYDASYSPTTQCVLELTCK
jgi:hypothetical protein